MFSVHDNAALICVGLCLRLGTEVNFRELLSTQIKMGEESRIKAMWTKWFQMTPSCKSATHPHLTGRDAPFGVLIVMSNEFDFEPRLGSIGHKKSAPPKPFVRHVLGLTYKSGFKTRRMPSFTGQRIGRDAAWGTLASSGFMNKRGRRAVVKVRIAKLKAGPNLVTRRDFLM
jgi:hypothetical protein